MMDTEPTPRTFCRRLTSTWSAQVVSSCALRLSSGDSTAMSKMGVLAGSKREMRGSSTSSFNSGRSSAIFSRTSSAALRPSMSRLNCTTVTELPS